MTKKENLPNNGYRMTRSKDLLLNYDDSVKNCSYFEHNFGEYALEGRIVYNEQGEMPWVLSVHGARSDYTKSDTVTLGLRERGYSTLGFNMSGHSVASKIPVEKTTLGHNIREAEAFYSYLHPQRKKKLIAYSIGTTPALKTLERNLDQVDKVILFGPGIYTSQAYDKYFGEQFRETVSAPFSYRETDVISILEAYQGELLLIKGEYDGLDPVAYGKPIGTSAREVEIGGQLRYSPIPQEVIEMINSAVPSSRCEMIVLPNCDHGVVPWIRDHPTEGSALLDKIASFLKGHHSDLNTIKKCIAGNAEEVISPAELP